MSRGNRSAFKTRLEWLWPCLWALSIFATSSGVVTIGRLSHAVATATDGHVAESQFRIGWEAIWWIVVKGWHAAEFAILYLLCRRARPNRPWPPIAIAALLAISDELHQLFVPYRGCRASDVCIDWLGIVTAWAFASGYLAKLKHRPIMLAIVTVAWFGTLFVLSEFPFGHLSIDKPESPSLAP